MNVLGKVLAFLNLGAALVILAWAVSVYGNQTPWVDRKTETETVKGQITLMKEEIDKLARSINDAQAGYGAKSAALAQAEAVRDYRRRGYAVRLAEARNGNFRIQLPDPNDKAFTNLEKQGQVIVGPDGKPLRGVETQSKEFRQLVRDAKLYREGTKPIPPNVWTDPAAVEKLWPLLPEMGIDDARRFHSLLSDRIKVVDYSVARQKEALANLRAEADYLADNRVNWAAELQILQRRQRQLEARLKAVGAGVPAE